MNAWLANAIIAASIVFGALVGTCAAFTIQDAAHATPAPVTYARATVREYDACRNAEYLANLTAKGYAEYVAAGSPDGGDYVTWAKANGFPYEDFGGRAVGGCLPPPVVSK